MNLTFTNLRGDNISLTNNELFTLTNIDGQTGIDTSISSLTVGGVDGDDINNVQAQPRTITLDLTINDGIDVEAAKRQILSIIKLKKSGTLTWTQNERTVTITGIVESIDMPRWEQDIIMQITLHCEQPFWEDVEEVISLINQAISLHYFTDIPNEMLYFTSEGMALSEYDIIRTRSIYNESDVDVGLNIEILAYKTTTNPIIVNEDGKFFGVGEGTGNKQVVMSEGDVVQISTHKGKKAVTLNGNSIIGKVKANSTWLQLEAGDNTFSINSDEAETDNVGFSLSYKRRYI